MITTMSHSRIVGVLSAVLHLGNITFKKVEYWSLLMTINYSELGLYKKEKH